MTTKEMLTVLEMHRVVRCRGIHCKVIGVEFHGEPTDFEEMTFILLPVGAQNWTPHSGLEARAGDCERGTSRVYVAA